MKVYLVGTCDCERTYVRYACLSKESAIMRWNELRLELIEKSNRIIKYECNKGLGNYWVQKENRNIVNLSETDPEILDNYPQEEPFIREMETEP